MGDACYTFSCPLDHQKGIFKAAEVNCVHYRRDISPPAYQTSEAVYIDPRPLVGSYKEVVNMHVTPNLHVLLNVLDMDALRYLFLHRRRAKCPS